MAQSGKLSGLLVFPKNQICGKKPSVSIFHWSFWKKQIGWKPGNPPNFRETWALKNHNATWMDFFANQTSYFTKKTRIKHIQEFVGVICQISSHNVDCHFLVRFLIYCVHMRRHINKYLYCIARYGRVSVPKPRRLWTAGLESSPATNSCEMMWHAPTKLWKTVTSHCYRMEKMVRSHGKTLLTIPVKRTPFRC